MRVLMWWPGTQVALSDVASGLTYGLEQNGVQVLHYRTDAHMEAAGGYLMGQWKRRVKKDPGLVKPNDADILYLANQAILTQALRYQPDWIVLISGLYQHPDFAVFLRRAGFRIALICTESPYDLGPELNLARFADIVFTNERSVTRAFRTVNDHVVYLPHAWHPGVHGVMEQGQLEDVPSHDVVYVGTGFWERVALLSAIDWTGIDFGLYGTWNLIPSRHHLRQHIRGGEVLNQRTAALYNRAKVGLNLHRTSMKYAREQTALVRRAESLNPRCYELAACRLFFTTDARAEVREIFGETLPTFDSPAGAEAVIRRALAEPAWRQDVAEACWAAVQPHTWTARAEAVLAALDGYPVSVAA
jgi:spore maturation protein CgeB